MKPDGTHLVIMPAYNPGPVLEQTVREVLKVWDSLWVVIDGSNDASEAPLQSIEGEYPGFRLLPNAVNQGKGAAVLGAAAEARRAGFTHALVMDCDGQHPVSSIEKFMGLSKQHTRAMILGQPIFGSDVPKERLLARQISVGLAWIEVMGTWVGDPLFGFRVYPLKELCTVLAKAGRGRRYDFDHEAVVRLNWQNVPALKVPARCRYPGNDEGGVSHFHYFRDNLGLVWLHVRLLSEWLFRTPRLLSRRRPEVATRSDRSSMSARNT